MDWFDQYLNALSDGKNVVYPPDSHTWRPVKPTKQQQSLIQDSMVADAVRMRLIQEARQAEIDQGMGGGYDAGSAAKERRSAPTPVSSGIPVASTASVVIGNAGAGNNGTYVKKVPQQLLLDTGPVELYSNIAGTCYVLGAGNADGRILFSPDAQAWDDLGFGTEQFGTPFGNWKLGYVYYEGGDISSWLFTEIATNASTNPNFIPTTGWTPSITITAA